MSTSSGVLVQSQPGHFVATWRWYRWHSGLVVSLGVGMLLFALATLVASQLPLMIFQGVVFCGIGGFILYVGVSDLVNASTLVVNDQHITVTHGPLPWRGCRVPRAGVTKVDVVEDEHGRGRVIRLAVVLEGRTCSLVSRAMTRARAGELQQLLTQYLASPR